MVKVGIDKLAIYTPRYKLDLATLALARQIDSDKYQIGLGQTAMSVPAPGEDIITMAANAAHEVLHQEDLSAIELCLFATESSIDQSKAAAIYIHELLGLPSRCRALELKQACYSATAALQLALPFLRENPYKKVLLIAADIARYGLNTPGESSQGAGAVAMLLSANPRILALETDYGIVTESIMDFWRPNYRHEALVDGKYSSKVYLTMLEKTWQQYQTLSGRTFKDHDYFCYHAPLPRLVEKAHQHLRKINQVEGGEESEVAHSLIYARQMGNSYTAALYVCLASLLDYARENIAGKRIGFYSYGSGCVAEYFSGVVQPQYRNALFTPYHAQLFSSRQTLSYKEYEHFYTFPYAEDEREQTIPVYQTGRFRLAKLNKHKRFYEKVTQAISAPLEFPKATPAPGFKKVYVPGKLILSGEHAVVYGKPALAMAINRFVTATVTHETQPQVSFDLSDLSHRSHLSFQALKHLKNRIKNKYHRFIKGDFSIRDVLQKPFELAQFAMSLIAETMGMFTLPHGMKVHLQSEIPIGCGMGSSAATILSVMQAIAMHLQIPISQEMLYKMALEAENMQHGQSSGLDLRIALQGGCLYMEKTHIERRHIPNMPFYLVNTGTPSSSTGQCVEKAANYFNASSIGEDFAAVTKAMDMAIQQQSLAEMQHCIQDNHRLLVKIGVVPEKVQRFIRGIEEKGGAGKICGAGAVSGQSAGGVLVALEDQTILNDLCQTYDFQLLKVKGLARGMYAA